MQNPDFLRHCLLELEPYGPIEIIRGDSYHPILAVRLNDFALPAPVLERHVDIIIPMPRCAGYLPGACLAGLHVTRALHGVYQSEETVIPFCDPVENNDWMVKTKRFYPFYENDSESLIGTSYLCLNDPEKQPETPAALLRVAMKYLFYWVENAFGLAKHHGAIARGLLQGDANLSAEWIDHLVEQVSPGVKKKLLGVAYPPAI